MSGVMKQYQLAKGVSFEELEPTPEGKREGLLSIPYPQRIIRLSSDGVQALKFLCSQGIGADITYAKLRAFADNLENHGILQRHFFGLTPEQLPEVSIVIPTYNRRTMLGFCLDSLINLNYPKEKTEIIVVDDCSPEPVEIGDRPLVKLIRMPQNNGPGAARNEAVRQAKGEIIAFLDDDCLADKDWLQALVPCFQDPDVAAAGGRVESAVLTSHLDNYEQVQSPLLMGDHQRKVRKGSSVSYLATCNLLVRKESFLAAGGFDPVLRVGEDVDLCWRILARGEAIYYIPQGLILHYHRSQVLPFLKRRLNYGQSEAKLQSRYSEETRKLFYFPGNGFILGAVALIFLLKGSFLAVMAGMGLVMLNLVWQTVHKIRSFLSPHGQPRFGRVFLAMLRSQSTAVYIFSQHFARYYSIPVSVLGLIIYPQIIPVFLALSLLPGVVDYRIKKPSVPLFYFLSYNFLENLFYQAGVFSGCLKEHNWRPLAMNFIRADANFLNK